MAAAAILFLDAHPLHLNSFSTYQPLCSSEIPGIRCPETELHPRDYRACARRTEAVAGALKL